jgi:hypothetical protein
MNIMMIATNDGTVKGQRTHSKGRSYHFRSVPVQFFTINGTTQYLWWAVDQHGTVLDSLVQSRRNKHAAKQFFRKVLKGYQYLPQVLITDQLADNGAAQQEILRSVQHHQRRCCRSTSPYTALVCAAAIGTKRERGLGHERDARRAPLPRRPPPYAICSGPKRAPPSAPTDR